MDLYNKVPQDKEVYALSPEDENHIRAEFIETKGESGAECRICWRLYDRFGRGVLLTEEAVLNLCKLTSNYLRNNAR